MGSYSPDVYLLCCTDYEVGSPEQSTELSGDTDCDGSSIPEDSPEVINP